MLHYHYSPWKRIYPGLCGTRGLIDRFQDYCRPLNAKQFSVDADNVQTIGSDFLGTHVWPRDVLPDCSYGNTASTLHHMSLPTWAG